MEKEGKVFLAAESNFFNFNHAETAFEICKQWGLPEVIRTAIKDNHKPSYSYGNKLSYILYIADQVARMIDMDYKDDDILHEIKDKTIDFLGLRNKDINKITLKITGAADKIFY